MAQGGEPLSKTFVRAAHCLRTRGLTADCVVRVLEAMQPHPSLACSSCGRAVVSLYLTPLALSGLPWAVRSDRLFVAGMPCRNASEATCAPHTAYRLEGREGVFCADVHAELIWHAPTNAHFLNRRLCMKMNRSYHLLRERDEWVVRCRCCMAMRRILKARGRLRRDGWPLEGGVEGLR